MAENVKKAIKPMVMELRKKGFSYSDIQKEIFVPKATLSLWLKNQKLAPVHIGKLKKRRLDALKMGSEKRIQKILKKNSEIQKAAEENIKNISKRELWLMGIILCWRSGLTSSNKKYVYFSSVDPNLANLFLKWLRNIGGLEKEEIEFDIFLPRNRKKSKNKIISFWSKVTGFSDDKFSHIYYQKILSRPTRKKTKILGKPAAKDDRLIDTIEKKHNIAQHGFLRIRVRSSSMLNKQIIGWIEGIKKNLNLTN